VGGAVQRNRVKRLLREFFRLNQKLLPLGVDVVVTPKAKLEPDQLDYHSLEKEILPLLTGLFKAGRSAGSRSPSGKKEGDRG
jgi:ribonuclease P protein component